MLLARSTSRRPRTPDPTVVDALRGVSADNLRASVEAFAFPRSYEAERAANVRARDMLADRLRCLGYGPVFPGTHGNVVAATGHPDYGPCTLLGAHYDTVPDSPGADDNASALAVCLECARLLRKYPAGPTAFVFFNREEDGMHGSREFVAGLGGRPARVVREAHVFEMVGFRSRAPGSQRAPRLPGVAVPEVGDFLALLANGRSHAAAEGLLTAAATYAPALSVLALKTCLGVERLFGHLLRSDHAPFWAAGVPAVMWTDTSEFRNPHYHRESDTPETLDYDFLAEVTRLALARVLSRPRR
jgi:Zn-dependent M28 family amino/carboxypeptidase